MIQPVLRSVVVALVAVTSALAALAQATGQPSDTSVAASLRRVPLAAAPSSYESLLPALDAVYRTRGYKPLWTQGEELSAAGLDVLEAIRGADEEGLAPEEYLLRPIEAIVRTPSAAGAGDLDVLVSLAVVRYAHDLGWGITLPSEVDKATLYAEKPFDAAAVLAAVAAAPSASAALRGFALTSFVYGQLRLALAELRAIEARGGWATAAPGPTLRQGDVGPRVGDLRERLVERGDLPPSHASGDSFDAPLRSALLRFQERHGLTVDGIYGKAVTAELNVPIATRISQVCLAMERLRWLPPATTLRRVAVNLAAFRAYVFDGDTVAFEARTVIGARLHETPMFTGTMTEVVINPSWIVPASIAQREILPKARADAAYLARNHMVLEGTTIRQTPGPWNALGRFKFVVPNPYGIYLHDTPERSLFERADRAFSHGCVRVDRAVDLATVLLGRQGWTAERLAAVVESGQQTAVALETPVSFTIGYATAFRTPDGLLHFRRDVYGRDATLLAALAARRRAGASQP